MTLWPSSCTVHWLPNTIDFVLDLDRNDGGRQETWKTIKNVIDNNLLVDTRTVALFNLLELRFFVFGSGFSPPLVH